MSTLLSYWPLNISAGIWSGVPTIEPSMSALGRQNPISDIFAVWFFRQGEDLLMQIQSELQVEYAQKQIISKYSLFPDTLSLRVFQKPWFVTCNF